MPRPAATEDKPGLACMMAPCFDGCGRGLHLQGPRPPARPLAEGEGGVIPFVGWKLEQWMPVMLLTLANNG